MPVSAQRVGAPIASMCRSDAPDVRGLERMAMQTQRPHLLVVDDDRAVLTLVGTGITCLDILRTLRSMNPQCEAVLTTGYESLDAAVDALKHNPQEGDVPVVGRTQGSQEVAGVGTVY